MKAAVHTSYGPPDVVRAAEVEKPAAKDDEVLVKVHATTVNRTDCGLRAAKPFIVRFFTGLIRPRVRILGNEFAGFAVLFFIPVDNLQKCGGPCGGIIGKGGVFRRKVKDSP